MLGIFLSSFQKMKGTILIKVILVANLLNSIFDISRALKSVDATEKNKID